MRLQLEIDETGNLWEGDEIVPPEKIRERAKEILDSGLNHMHVLTFKQMGFKKVLIFTTK